MRWVLLIVTVPLLASCVNAYKLAKSTAADEFNCSEENIELLRRGAATFVATGCTRQGVFQCAGGRCFNLMGMARDRASREGTCTFDEISVREVTPYVFRTEGCGVIATYHCEILAGSARCLMESREEPGSEPATTPTETGDAQLL